jgi:hypothetical protein
LAVAYDIFFGEPTSPKIGVTNYQSTINNIPGEQMPHAGIYFSRSVHRHGQMYVTMTQGRSQETLKVNAQDTYEQRISLKFYIYIFFMK